MVGWFVSGNTVANKEETGGSKDIEKLVQDGQWLTETEWNNVKGKAKGGSKNFEVFLGRPKKE